MCFSRKQAKDAPSKSNCLMTKILFAEDDPNLAFMIEDNLSELGYEVHWAKDGMEALDEFNKGNYQLCIIDIMMPKLDGFQLASKIREIDEWVPILFLTAKSMEEDKLKGFEIGGDDYITKPFSMKELDYRIKVFLRRISSEALRLKETIHFGRSTFDPRNLLYRNTTKEFSLTQMEAQLLTILIMNRNQLVKREMILEKIWGENDYFKGRSLDVFITRLRKYLKEDDSLEIKNHHGVGFCLVIT